MPDRPDPWRPRRRWSVARRRGALVAVVVLLAGAGAVPAAASQPATEGQPPPVRVVTKEFEPLVIRDGEAFSGFSIDVLEDVAERLDLAYEVHGVDTVTQLLDEVRAGKADLGVAGISVTSEREAQVDFSQPFYNSGLQVMVRSGPRSSGLTRTLAPLVSRPVVELLAILLLLMVVMAHVMWLVESRRPGSDFPRHYRKGIGDGMWWSGVTMTTVGYGDKTPRTAVGRVAGILWMFVAIVLVANFTATVASSLTVDRLQGGIAGPDDLSGKRVATVQGTTSAAYLAKLSLDLVQTERVDDAYRLLEQRKVDAVVFDSPVLLYHAETAARGSLRVVGPVFARQDYAIAMPLGSPWRKPINEALLAMMEDGSYEALRTKWFGR